jgi:hypothetical protein
VSSPLIPPSPKSKKEKTPTSHTGLFSILDNKKVAIDYSLLSPNCQKEKGGNKIS